MAAHDLTAYLDFAHNRTAAWHPLRLGRGYLDVLFGACGRRHTRSTTDPHRSVRTRVWLEPGGSLSSGLSEPAHVRYRWTAGRQAHRATRCSVRSDGGP